MEGCCGGGVERPKMHITPTINTAVFHNSGKIDSNNKSTVH